MPAEHSSEPERGEHHPASSGRSGPCPAPTPALTLGTWGATEPEAAPGPNPSRKEQHPARCGAERTHQPASAGRAPGLWRTGLNADKF